MQEREKRKSNTMGRRKDNETDQMDEARKNSELILAFGTIYRNIEHRALIHKKYPMM